MSPEEIAPPFETWNEHLKDLGDRELAELARDYRWLNEEARPELEREDFRRRKEAISAECKRRNMPDPYSEPRK